MSTELTQQLLDLTRQRRFEDVIRLWRASSHAARESEVPKRLVAAAFAQTGDLSAAAGLLRDLLTRTATDAASCALAGRVFFDLGQLDASLDAWERASALAPDNLGWWKWFAEAASHAGQPERALRVAETYALHREKSLNVALAHVNLLTRAQRAQEALIAFERIVVRWPHHPVAGPAFAEFVMREFPLESRQLLDTRFWRPVPATLSPEIVRALVWLPAFYESETEAAQWRARLLAQLGELQQLAIASPLRGMERAACLASTPFFAAFHDADITEIQFAWGDFVEALVAPLRGMLPALDASRRTVRKVGIVSNRFTDSSAGRFFNGWIGELVAAGFEVRLYALGHGDAETARLSRVAVMHCFPDEVGQWLSLSQQLYSDANDAIVFPEPQGSQLILLIAGLRCAPIQCAAFGNPVTTGLQTMDYFLVPDAAEVEASAPFYREAVVRLHGLGIALPAAPLASQLGRSAFGFSESERIYLVNQQLQKWTPGFVDALCDLLHRDKQARLVYFGVGANVSQRAAALYVRLVFGLQGIDSAARTTLVGRLARADFLALNRISDVSLDTFGYGGGSTTMDALGVGLPVVARIGRFLRNRQTEGMARAMGASHAVADDDAQFVELAMTAASAGARPRDIPVTLRRTRDAFPSGRSDPNTVRDIVGFFTMLNEEPVRSAALS